MSGPKYKIGDKVGLVGNLNYGWVTDLVFSESDKQYRYSVQPWTCGDVRRTATESAVLSYEEWSRASPLAAKQRWTLETSDSQVTKHKCISE